MLCSLFSGNAHDSLPTAVPRKLSRLPTRRRLFVFLVIAVLSGVVFQCAMTILLPQRRSIYWWGGEDIPEGASGPTLQPEVAGLSLHAEEDSLTVTITQTHTHTETAIRPAHTEPQELFSDIDSTVPTEWQKGEDRNDMDLEQLRTMVSRTKGYFTRDWSLGLGWNNMRYIIEAALLQSSLLNRTLIIPSFVYARACEYHEDVCSAYATLVDRENAVGWDKWNGAPLNTLAWHIPMNEMLDLPHLRRTHSVILTSEYLELQGLPLEIESLAGDWDRVGYHTGPLHPSLHVIPNRAYDPTGAIRVDRRDAYNHVYGQSESENRVNLVLEEHAGDGYVYDVPEARATLQAAGLGGEEIETDEGLEEVLRQGGWGSVYTFNGAAGLEYGKAVVEPITQIVSFGRCRGFLEDYDSITADVLILDGETHLFRKPGQMRFTTAAVRDEFARIVLYDFRATEKVRELADSVAERLREMVGERWMGAHMRRGDFVTVGFAQTGQLEDHLTKIKATLERGQQILLNMGVPQRFDVPQPRGAVEADSKATAVEEIVEDEFSLESTEPEQGGNIWFYLATDERTPEYLQYLRDNGALLFEDLVTVEERRKFGWPLLLTDVVGLVEQAILARSPFFTGYALSSVAGGVLNQRAARGADPRTSIIER